MMDKPDYWIIRLRDECRADEWIVASSVNRALTMSCRHVTVDVDVDGNVEIKGWRDVPVEKD